MLDSTIQNWLESGYSNRPQNQSGDISILKDNSFDKTFGYYTNTQDSINIKAGDDIYINGQKITTIGKGQAILESSYLGSEGNSNTCRLIVPNKPNETNNLTQKPLLLNLSLEK